MTTEEVIIAVVRVLGSLPVLVFPFWGALLAMATDQSDLFMMNLLHEGGVRDYQEFDKALDQVYMLTFLAVALRWRGPARSISVVLYVYRLVGFAAFEATQERDLLIFFPNVFEFWFVFVAGVKQFGREGAGSQEPGSQKPGSQEPGSQEGARGWGLFPFRYSGEQLGVVLPVLTVAKLGQEFVLHVGRFLDDFTAVEAVEWIWRVVTPPW